MTKRIGIWILALALLIAPRALANSWGVRGEIYDAVSRNSAWENYSTISDKCIDSNGVNAAVLGYCSHNALFVSLKGNGSWTEPQALTAAVWQRDDNAGIPKLSLDDTCLTLRYEAVDETYRFDWLPSWSGHCYALVEASVRGFELRWDGEGAYCSASGLRMGIDWPISLSEFNIRLFPTSEETLRQFNRNTGVLDDLFWNPVSCKGCKAKLPVYSAPDAASYRAASSKASVVPSAGVRYYWTEDGWDLIEYEVSARVSRIGYVQSAGLPSQLNVSELERLPMRTLTQTYLTDDPHVSQTPIATLETDETVEMIGQANLWYAYVEYGTAEGQTMRGFVPLCHLTLANPCARIPEQLTGAWLCNAGGAFGGEYLLFREDGTYTGYGVNAYSAFSIDDSAHTAASLPFDGAVLCRETNGTFRLYDYADARDRTGYLLEMDMPAGTGVYGLSLHENELLFHTVEGGGGYFRVTDDSHVPYDNVSDDWLD